MSVVESVFIDLIESFQLPWVRIQFVIELFDSVKDGLCGVGNMDLREIDTGV